MTGHFDYSEEPTSRKQHTQQYDIFYSRFASGYDRLVKILPLWRNWISAAIPWIQGPRVLEISFGTGYLLSQYADRFKTCGIDYNQRLARVAQSNLFQSGKKANLQVADVGSLPYKSATFDTLVNTMAFTAYPDGNLALSEMSRVLKPGGRIVMVDISYPLDGNLIGRTLTKAWKAGGDIIRDMPALFEKFGFEFSDQEIGGCGSVHLYVIIKPGKEDA
jgi:ubiquinone/menaquinone biosynthesis C-methylase UbiE